MIAQGRANDFVLFPSRQRQSDMLAFEHSRHLQSYGRHFNMDPTFPGLDMHPYGTFGSNSSYVPVSSAYFENPSFIVDAPQESLKHDQYRHAPSDSSSITTSQSSEASVLSTASGPSVPSASSSAVGSPYLGHAHAMPYQETWTDMNAGLGLGGPAILSHEGYGTDFVSSGLDHEVIFPPDKLGANFVGEYPQISSAIKPASIAFSIASSHSRVPNDTPTLALDTTSTSEASVITIDTILDRANSAVTTPKLSSPASGCSSISPVVKSELDRRLSRDDGNFKSPTTPASAKATTPSTFSSSSNQPSRFAALPSPNSATVKSRMEPPVSPQLSRQQARSQPGQDPYQHIYASHFQSPFFAQSSGNFVPPLESSCWFPRESSFLQLYPCSQGSPSISLPAHLP